MSPSHIAMQMNGNLNHRQETKVSEMNKTMFTIVSNFGHHPDPHHDDHVKKVGTIRLPILLIYCLHIAYMKSSTLQSHQDPHRDDPVKKVGTIGLPVSSVHHLSIFSPGPKTLQ